MAAKAKAQLKVASTAPTVIDEELVNSCVVDKPKPELHQVTTLALSYKSMTFMYVETKSHSLTDIAKIDNLVGLKSLTKLQLDNNSITEIENLGHLTNLEWLGVNFRAVSSLIM